MNGRLLTKTSFSIIWSKTYEARDQKYRSDDARCLDGILRSHNAAQVRFFPNISGSCNCSWGKYKECIQKETNTFSQLLWSGLAGIAALCSGAGAGKVKGAALGHHQQNKPAPCLHSEDRFFNNESKIIKEREKAAGQLPEGEMLQWVLVSLQFSLLPPCICSPWHGRFQTRLDSRARSRWGKHPDGERQTTTLRNRDHDFFIGNSKPLCV